MASSMPSKRIGDCPRFCLGSHANGGLEPEFRVLPGFRDVVNEQGDNQHDKSAESRWNQISERLTLGGLCVEPFILLKYFCIVFSVHKFLLCRIFQNSGDPRDQRSMHYIFSGDNTGQDALLINDGYPVDFLCLEEGCYFQ